MLALLFLYGEQLQLSFKTRWSFGKDEKVI
jgi:hypothetical protein